MSGRVGLLGMLGTLLALSAGYLIWQASDLLVEVLRWSDLLPIVRLCVVVLGLSFLEFLVQGLRRVFLHQDAQTPRSGESQ